MQHTAQISPCYTCKAWLKREPILGDCITFCWQLNQHLINIGEQPHTGHFLPKENLAELFPPASNSKFPTVVSTREQFMEAAKKVSDIIKIS